eukprot:1367741-Amorphochlora_amoeboformis.AAC.2
MLVGDANQLSSERVTEAKTKSAKEGIDSGRVFGRWRSDKIKKGWGRYELCSVVIRLRSRFVPLPLCSILACLALVGQDKDGHETTTATTPTTTTATGDQLVEDTKTLDIDSDNKTGTRAALQVHSLVNETPHVYLNIHIRTTSSQGYPYYERQTS